MHIKPVFIFTMVTLVMFAFLFGMDLQDMAHPSILRLLGDGLTSVGLAAFFAVIFFDLV